MHKDPYNMGKEEGKGRTNHHFKKCGHVLAFHSALVTITVLASLTESINRLGSDAVASQANPIHHYLLQRLVWGAESGKQEIRKAK